MNKRPTNTTDLIFLKPVLPSRLAKLRMPLYYVWILVFVVFLPSRQIKAQTQEDNTAFDILNKAMGVMLNEEGSMAVYFEGIAFDVKKPTDVFTLPAYKVHRGGFFVSYGQKFEIQLGLMKALCDGKIMVVIDESSKTMVIDSLRDKMPESLGEMPDMEKLLGEHFPEGVLNYHGKEMINGKLCHMVKAEFPEDKSRHVFYWVEVSTNKLQLIGEWQGSSYDAYWVKKVSRAPTNHDYSVNLPKKELESFYGYQVFDFRYITNEFMPKEH